MSSAISVFLRIEANSPVVLRGFFVPDSGNLWNMIGFGCPTAFILNNFKMPER